MFNEPAPAASEVNIYDLIPAEHHAEARQFFREVALAAQVNGVTLAEALAEALRPHLKQLRRQMGVEAFEEQGLTIRDARGNTLQFAFADPHTRHLKSS